MLTTCLTLIAVSTDAMSCPPISASSAADTDGCSRGALRPYQAHIAISGTAGRLAHSSACCHPNADMRWLMSGGVNAAPRPNPMVCSPCTKAQRRGGNQTSNTPADTGKTAACEHPSSNCRRSNAANKPAPVNQ